MSGVELPDRQAFLADTLGRSRVGLFIVLGRPCEQRGVFARAHIERQDAVHVLLLEEVE
jgi:hypothetical protein